jgi:hypothetical protein
VIVGFSRAGNPLSYLIRAVTRTNVSHAWMMLPVQGVELVFQSDTRGVNLEAYERFKAGNTVVNLYDVDLDFTPTMPELFEELGAGYDFGGLLGQPVVMLGQTLGRHWANPWQSEGRWYCSELVAHLMQKAGAELPAPPAAIRPDTLRVLLDKAPFAKPVPV